MQHDMNAGISLAETLQHGRQHAETGGHRTEQADLAHQIALVRQLTSYTVPVVHRLLGIVLQGRSGSSQAHTATVALKQRLANGCLKALHTAADRRYAHMMELCRAAEIKCAAD